MVQESTMEAIERHEKHCVWAVKMVGFGGFVRVDIGIGHSAFFFERERFITGNLSV